MGNQVIQVLLELQALMGRRVSVVQLESLGQWDHVAMVDLRALQATLGAVGMLASLDHLENQGQLDLLEAQYVN